MASEVKTIQADRLKEYCVALFRQVGVPEDEAYITADNLVEADLTGVESHGVSRMAIYMKRLRQGGVRPKLEVKTIVDAPAMAVIDACNSMGAPVGVRSMELAIEKAKSSAISFAAYRHKILKEDRFRQSSAMRISISPAQYSRKVITNLKFTAFSEIHLLRFRRMLPLLFQQVLFLAT